MIRLARPGHWIKNIIVLFPVVFAEQMANRSAWLCAGLAAIAFCFASSTVYVFNDIHDCERDRKHPRKKDRPLSSGRISLRSAVLEGIVLLVAAVVMAWTVNAIVLGIVLGYLLLQLAYTLVLKQKMLVDVMCIALGFVLRAAAGAVAITVAISPWLVMCTFTICLFMGFCKRCNEVVTMGHNSIAREHRQTLEGYTIELLTHLITLSAAVAIVSFLLYASNPATVSKFGSNFLVYTAPLVIYGVFRFAMLSMMGKYAGPTDLILHDWPFKLTCVIWTLSAAGIICWGDELRTWMQGCVQS